MNSRFVKTLIDELPCGVLILDENQRIRPAPFSFDGTQGAIVIIDNISRLEIICGDEQRELPKKIIGEHQSVREIYTLIHEAALVDLPVLIQGESGTGKELVAQEIHDASPRRKKPFVIVNCGALPHNLLESELFGHEKGAFTGALFTKKGRFELADRGTIFLDEIGELDLSLQVKILRVLQEGVFERVGGTKTLRVDARIISATNRKLDHEVAEGRFRLDLFYRLCVVPINVPTLRERFTDIPLLAAYFLEKVANSRGLPIKTLSAQCFPLLKAHNWPGNVRELQNVLQFAMMKCQTEIIEQQHLPQYLQDCANVTKKPGAVHRPSPIKLPREPLNMAAVMAALEKTKGNKSAAATELGVGRATLYRFLNNSNLPQ